MATSNDKPQAVNGPTGETEVDPKVADMEAELVRLRAQLASAKVGAVLPEGSVWVVAADGTPIQGVPHAPKAWLDEHAYLLPAGAREASDSEQERLEAIEVARRRPQL